MYRKALSKLEKWQLSNHRVPLLLRGARQVGKTWLAREHGKKHSSIVEINFEAEPAYHLLFKNNFSDPVKLIKDLSLLKKKTYHSW